MSTAATIPPKPEHLDVHCEEDLLVVRICGPYDEAVARHLEFLYVDLANRYGYRLALLFGRETTTITPEARRLMAEWNAVLRDPFAGAVVGASFTAKTIANMLIRAMELITRRPTDLSFCDTEAEARAWLDKQRPRLETQAQNQRH